MSELLNKQVLILNSDCRPLSMYPLSTNSLKKVIKSILKERVTVLEEYPETITISGMEIHIPKVVVLRKYINAYKAPKFTRNNVYLRDSFTCQYCGKTFTPDNLTFDHVIPRTLGGKTTWTNIVTACKECNTKKGGKLLQDTNMKLLSMPKVPSNNQLLKNLKTLNKELGLFTEKMEQLKIWDNWLGSL